jgi:hypothetical protein
MTPQQRADKIATKYMYLPSGMANDIAEAIRDAVAEQFNANDERMAASLKRQNDLRQELDMMRTLMDKIASNRTVSEWEQFAKGEGLDPYGADYSGAYDAIIRDVRAARKRSNP